MILSAIIKPIRYSFIISLFTTLFLLIACDEDSFQLPESDSRTITGSTSKFLVNDDYLYTIDDNTLYVFDVSDSAKLISNNYITDGIETLFINGDQLVIGTLNGALFYDISDPSRPNYLSTYNHVTACDPVVTHGNYAYVTLRTGTQCRRGVNRLDIINITNIAEPQHVKSIDIESPFGMTIQDDMLLVSQNNNGLSIFDISNPEETKLLKKHAAVNSKDLIKNGDILVAHGKFGITQFTVNDTGSINVISQLSFSNL
ncbi:LVIVD repeat-containing protein [Reichenbachiella versicolor]|uniref:LVIVD repeat-containing protein n=1 Tax=Reichenbachiella versicolor TaxID=1821036 RepID=UPI0013A539D8|nr:hypothetical protein [Reichenbachiella versicolor]